MSVEIKLKDGKGKGLSAAVDTTNNLCVSSTGVPPEAPADNIRIFRQYMTTDGLVNNGTNQDMQVVGTLAAPVEFYIPSAPDADRYIKSIAFLIADQNSNLNTFGAITALTNGCQLFYEDPTLGTVIIHEALQSNWDFNRLCGQGAMQVGNTTNVFKADNIFGNSDGYGPVLDFTQQFGLPWGIRIPKASELRIVLTVRDTTTGVDAFDAIAYGYDRLV